MDFRVAHLHRLSLVLTVVVLLGLLAAIEAPSAGQGETKVVYVPDDYPSIGEALRSTGPGAVILVRPGVYHENIVFPEPGKTVRGLGDPHSVVIVAASAGSPAVEVGVDNVTLENVTIIAKGVGIKVSEDHFTGRNLIVNSSGEVAVRVYDASHVTLENIVITAGGEDGLILSSSSNIVATNVTVKGGRHSLRIIFSSNVTVANSTFYSTLYISRSRNVRIVDVSVYPRTGAAISAGEPSHLLIASSYLESRDTYTINVIRGKYVEIQGNMVNASKTAIGVTGNYIKITGNTIVMGLNGVMVKGSHIIVERNNVSSAKGLSGISIEGRDILVEANHIVVRGGNGEALSARLTSNTTVRFNYLEGGYAPLSLSECSNTTFIYLNTMIEGEHAASLGTSVRAVLHTPTPFKYKYRGAYHVSYLGNYWSNYRGVDSDGDGVGDQPYKIGWREDRYPLIEPPTSYTELQPAPTAATETAANTTTTASATPTSPETGKSSVASTPSAPPPATTAHTSPTKTGKTEQEPASKETGSSGAKWGSQLVTAILAATLVLVAAYVILKLRH